LDLPQNDYSIVCIEATSKGFVCGHKNAGIITHFEISTNNEIILRG
jgi:hypothetical protein